MCIPLYLSHIYNAVKPQNRKGPTHETKPKKKVNHIAQLARVASAWYVRPIRKDSVVEETQIGQICPELVVWL
jgi:hypothetical protein